MGQDDNFYRKFGLDPSETSENLGILLAGRDAQFDQFGVAESSPERREVLVAYGILSRQESRSLYDQAIMQQRPLSQGELEHLSNFGSWPVVAAAPRQDSPIQPVNPFAASSAIPYSNLPAAQPPSPNPYGSRSEIESRASSGMRMLMATGDFFLALTVAGIVAGIAPTGSDGASALFIGLVMVLYTVGFEVFTGATPVKHMCGYTVRDINTKQSLTMTQSAKRNWWRLINIVPGIGQLISFVAAIGYAISINPGNAYLGTQDRMANAEVVKKN